MKTIEQKAIAYDKALERAKEIINSYEKRGLEEILFYAKEDLGGIFTELKEGEYYDERIRKAIILAIKDNETLVSMNGFTKNDMIAWLESDIEQKPAEWSHEDDVMVHDILGLLPVKTHPEYNQRRTDWIKSLKDRIHPQQEWSEEDEMERKRIIGLLEGWLSTFKETCYAEDCKCGIDWLKSLKQKNAWKASEEQLKLLQHYADQNNYDGTVLTSLLNDLKKLGSTKD